ncbi:MAG TPA: MFS transporter [Myxococcales bacterium]|nr:MFS transporter [Myxococcales bacterium]
MTDAPAERRGRALPAQVLWLGLVSFLTDVSSEAIFAVLPIFLVAVLGASTVTLGLMEGLADFAASSLDLASGYVADRTGRKKRLTALGYGFSASSKLLLVAAVTVPQVLVFRVIERLGKSIRGPPRDALLAGTAPAAHRGFAFGVHKAFDKAGAVVGPLLAFALLGALGPSRSSFHRLFLFAVVPAFAAVAVLLLAVREVAGEGAGRRRLGEVLREAGAPYRRYLYAVAVFSLGYSSFAFLLLKAGAVGFPPQQVALLYALYNGSSSLASAPIGRLGDRLGRRRIIALSYALHAATMLGLALAQSKGAVVGLFLLHGCFYSIDEGQTKAFISDLVPAGARATAMGLYGLITGVMYLPASLLAGALWERGGPELAFGCAGALAVVALALLLSLRPEARVAG